jgi:hypothetical protein
MLVWKLKRAIDVRSDRFGVVAACVVAEGVTEVSVKDIGRKLEEVPSGTDADCCVLDEAEKFASASRALGLGKLSMEVD